MRSKPNYFEVDLLPNSARTPAKMGWDSIILNCDEPLSTYPPNPHQIKGVDKKTSHLIFNERELVLELLNVVKVKVKVKVKVTMKKFRNCFLLPELLDDLWYC